MSCARWLLPAFALPAFVLMAVSATPALADSVYRCRGADDAIAYQDRPCAAHQKQVVVAIEPAPAADARPEAEPPRSRAPTAKREAARMRATRSAAATSWQCRAASGEVFYRHSGCPKALPSPSPAPQRRGAAPPRIPVVATTVPRAQACRHIASEYGRKGAERDERPSTYERNLGRDACRHP